MAQAQAGTSAGVTLPVPHFTCSPSTHLLSTAVGGLSVECCCDLKSRLRVNCSWPQCLRHLLSTRFSAPAVKGKTLSAKCGVFTPAQRKAGESPT